jgi:hypothetical protein
MSADALIGLSPKGGDATIESVDSLAFPKSAQARSVMERKSQFGELSPQRRV